MTRRYSRPSIERGPAPLAEPVVEYVVVAVCAMFVSGLTLFSGFGLGTLLLPVFALFFPIDVAVAATAAVHGANNVLKVALLGRGAERGIVLRFGIPAVIAALFGASLLGVLSARPPIGSWTWAGLEGTLTPIKLIMGLLMAAFALFELLPSLRSLQFDRRYLFLGGTLSGFFGGLSGHQGALRSAFLAKVGISTAAFVGTNAVIGLAVDLVRLSTYGWVYFTGGRGGAFQGAVGSLVLTGIAAAFAGVLVGKQLIPKVTMHRVQTLTGSLLLIVAVLLGTGLI